MYKPALVLLFIPALACASHEPQRHTPEQEISHLIGYLQGSGCQLKRNRVWQDANEAVGHFSRQYRSLSGQRPVESAEEFIRSAASQSRVTGQPYMVRCEDGREQPSALWLGAELQRYRNSH